MCVYKDDLIDVGFVSKYGVSSTTYTVYEGKHHSSGPTHLVPSNG